MRLDLEIDFHDREDIIDIVVSCRYKWERLVARVE